MSTVHARNRGSRFRSLHADYAVIDFETTGMRDNDAIVEIGVVLLDKDLSVEDTWEALVNPHRLILNTDVHGIKEEHVDRGLTFPAFAGYFKQLLHGRTLVAHGAFATAKLLRCLHEEHDYSRDGTTTPHLSSSLTLIPRPTPAVSQQRKIISKPVTVPRPKVRTHQEAQVEELFPCMGSFPDQAGPANKKAFAKF